MSRELPSDKRIAVRVGDAVHSGREGVGTLVFWVSVLVFPGLAGWGAAKQFAYLALTWQIAIGLLAFFATTASIFAIAYLAADRGEDE